MDSGISRRAFLKGAAAVPLAAAGLDLLLPATCAGGAPAAGAPSALGVAAGGTPEALVRRAVGALGGMQRFVGKGDVVVVKPNIGWDRTVEQGANTHPEVVRTVARLCREAGAAKVRVMDRPCNDPRRCYKQSGIKDAIESLGDPAVTLEHLDPRGYVERTVPGGSSPAGWTFHRDVLEADRVINVPVAKHHNATRLTMSLKNVMGIVGGNRGNIHHDLDRNIVGLNRAFRFHLIVLDAVRILTANGPQGGKVSDVRATNTVVAGTDPVAVDACGATLFGIGGNDVPHVLLAHEAGLGEIDLKKVKISRA